MKCETCEGRGFIEYEHGLIQVECEVCGGTGEVGKESELAGELKDKVDNLTKAGETFEGLVNEAHRIIDSTARVKDDSISGDRPDNQPTGSKDTSKHKQPRKPKARKKTTKRLG